MSAIRVTHEDSPEFSITPRPSLSARFTLDGSDHLEHRLATFCRLVTHEIRRLIPGDKLEGILLGGGYGRGEGGVLRLEDGDHLYNDLEFYVFMRGNDRLNEWRYHEALHELGRQMSPVAGVDVEFKIISTARLRRSKPTMFYYDLALGHRRFWGNEQLLAGCEHLQRGSDMPVSEATRLLMNRCSGLLFAREKLGHKNLTDHDADFVGRNLAKAQLGFGDAVLAAFGDYHWSCLERHDRLRDLKAIKDLPWQADLRRHHSTGIKFKLHPVRSPADRQALQKLHDELTNLGLRVWLWVEAKRLGREFVSANEYALSHVNKWPGRPWSYNWLANAKVSGTSGAKKLLKREAFRHPRERVLNLMTLLLWEPRALFSSGNPSKAVRDYQKLWQQVN